MSDLEVQTEYFKKAADAWEEVAGVLADAGVKATIAPSIPTLWGTAGSFNDVVTRVNELADVIDNDLLWNGRMATEEMVRTLKQICRDYVITNAETAEEARKLEAIINGS